jgi:putative copper resistance protein D
VARPFGPARYGAHVAVPPPPPSLRTLLLPARVDVVALVLVMATTWCYLRWVRRLAGKGRVWSRARTGAFLGGLAVIIVATQTGVARYDTVLFSDHVFQHVLLGMLAPVLLACGSPITLALQAASPGTRQLLRKGIASRAMGVSTNPLMALGLFGATLFVLYFTPLYEASLRNGVLHAWIHIHFVVIGFLFASAVVGLDVHRGLASYPARLGLVLATVPFHAFLGVALLTSTTVIAGNFYAAQGRTWGPSALADQHSGAGILWAAGEIFGLVLGAVVLARWMASSEREARRQDELLDAGLLPR